MNGRRAAVAAAGLATAIAIWKAGSLAVGSDLILPAPETVLAALAGLSASQAFRAALAGSLGRVLAAFAISVAAGSLTGAVSARWRDSGAFLAPLLTAIRATPVLALILVAMFWFSSHTVPIFTGVLMAYPVFHTAAETGFRAADRSLLEMSALFRVPRRRVLRSLIIPSAMPYLLSGAKSALGLCWKVVVAGEVLSQPRAALGTGMQDARLSLETPLVFAWAAATIMLCGASEYLLGLAARRLARHWSGAGRITGTGARA